MRLSPKHHINRAKRHVAEKDLGERLLILTVVWFIVPILVAIMWGISVDLLGGFGQQAQSYRLLVTNNMFVNGWPTAWLLVWYAICFVITTVVMLVPFNGGDSAPAYSYRSSLDDTPADSGGEDIVVREIHWFRYIIAVVSAVAAVLAVVSWSMIAPFNADKVVAVYDNSATTFVIPSANTNAWPPSLRLLLKFAHTTNGHCALVGAADVPSCVNIGQMPEFDWSARTASYGAAETIMASSGSTVSSVDVLDPTIHYLPGTAANTGVWTGVLDGSGRTQSTQGVDVWDGLSNTSNVCQFGGDDNFNRAFSGTSANSLGNLIAEHFPTLLYQMSDVWGYCTGKGPISSQRPVIVIPVTHELRYQHRTVQAPAGILVLTGSPSGTPTMAYHPTVNNPKAYPGPVYPESLAKTQIDATQWAAGRGDKDGTSFGYERTTIDTNSDNPGEYVMRALINGREYFVTPLTPNNSKSQSIVAIAIVPADTVNSGPNPLTVYVTNVARPTSLSVIESRMQSYLDTAHPSLLNKGSNGAFREIIPLGDDMWRGFVDISGITQDYVDLSGNPAIPPVFVTLPTSQNYTSSGTGNGKVPDCAYTPSMLTTQVGQCATFYVGQLQLRAAATAPKG